MKRFFPLAALLVTLAPDQFKRIDSLRAIPSKRAHKLVIFSEPNKS